MSNVNIILAKLFRQALRQGALSELSGGKRAHDAVSAHASGSARENQCAALSIRRLDVVLFQCEDSAARK